MQDLGQIGNTVAMLWIAGLQPAPKAGAIESFGPRCTFQSYVIPCFFSWIHSMQWYAVPVIFHFSSGGRFSHLEMRPFPCWMVKVTGYLPVANNFPGSFFWRGLVSWMLDWFSYWWKPGANGDFVFQKFMGDLHFESIPWRECGLLWVQPSWKYRKKGNFHPKRCAMISRLENLTFFHESHSDYRNFKEWICRHALLVLLESSKNAPTETSDGLYAVAFSFALDLTPSTWMLDRSACW